jgi:hydrogenase maturation protease
MKRTLILGFGNVDRQDDGAAWHVLVALAQKLGRQRSILPEEGFSPEGDPPHLLSALQLTPEMAETIAGYERICFVDTYTGSIPEEILFTELRGETQISPFTHHLTPQSCLAMCENLYDSHPEAILVSMRGYEFGFSRTLSTKTASLVERASDEIWQWLTASESH